MGIEIETSKIVRKVNEMKSKNIPNEDIVQEYIEAKSRGDGDQYKEGFVEDTDSDVDPSTKSYVKSLSNADLGNINSIRELKTKIDSVHKRLYSSDNIRRAINKMEDKLNEKLGGTYNKTISSLKGLGDILKQNKYLTFAGLKISILMKELSLQTAAWGAISAVVLGPIMLGFGIHQSEILLGFKWIIASTIASLTGFTMMKTWEHVEMIMRQIHYG